MTTAAIHIGITSIGSGVGQSIIDACRLSRLPLVTHGFGCNPYAYGAFDCDHRALVPPVRDPDYVDALLARCREHRVQLLIPGLDYDLSILAPHRARFAAEGVKVILGSEAFVHLCRDKVHMSQSLRRITTAFVQSYDRATLLKAVAAETASFPLIAKPRDGFASRGLRILHSAEDVAKVTDEDVVQDLAIPAPTDAHHRRFVQSLGRGVVEQVAELSLQLVLSREGKVLGRMATYNKLNNGVPIEIVPVEDDSLWEPIEQVLPYLHSLGASGPINFQGRLTADGLRFFEMNARFTGITGLRAMMGFNEVEALIVDFMELGCGSASLQVNPRKVGLRQVANRIVEVDSDPDLQTAVRSIPRNAGSGRGLRVGITGATGYLGRRIVEHLSRMDTVDSIAGLSHRAPDTFTSDIDWIDLNDEVAAGAHFAQLDVLIHAGFAREHRGPEEIALSLRRAATIARWCSQVHLPRIINCSSQSVYGLARPPLWSETLPAAPETAYAQAKYAVELLFDALARTNPTTRVTSLRFARLFGAADNMRCDELPHLFLRNTFEGRPIKIRGGSQRLDLLNVEDAASAVISLLQFNSSRWKPVYNVGSGCGVGIQEIAATANEVARAHGGDGAEVVVEPAELRLNLGMDISRITADTGWTPKLTLRDSFKTLLTTSLAVPVQ